MSWHWQALKDPKVLRACKVRRARKGFKVSEACRASKAPKGWPDHKDPPVPKVCRV